MLVLVGGSSAWFLWLAVGVFGKRAGGEGRVNSSKSNSVEGSFLSPVMVLMLLPYALHALALSMIPFTSAHVQIALRVLPAATPWAAWAGIALIIKGEQTNQPNEPFVVDRSSEGGEQKEPGRQAESAGAFVASRLEKEGSRSWWIFISHLWIGWSVVWVLVSSVLWLAFLPPA
ncbi:hypothetical protein BDV93DRAFT_565774 [Ceratobasidium sp. AG-I]|nr:hypothetical protein BDV93DRAFT_565774 [Ceratobasidium sp. AG-I]